MSKKKKKKLRKNEEGLREMQDNMKHNNIRIIGIPEGEEEEQGIENLFEKVMMGNFPNLMRGTSPRSREGTNQEEPKEAHSKAHHNQNGKI